MAEQKFTFSNDPIYGGVNVTVEDMVMTDSNGDAVLVSPNTPLAALPEATRHAIISVLLAMVASVDTDATEIAVNYGTPKGTLIEQVREAAADGGFSTEERDEIIELLGGNDEEVAPIAEGEAEVATTDEGAEAETEETPAEDEAADEALPAMTPMTKPEVIAALIERGIKFDRNNKKEVLHALLMEACKEELLRND